MKTKRKTPKAQRNADLTAKFHEIKEDWLQEHDQCERCNGSATEIHHKKGRQFEEDGIPLIVHEDYFMAVCRPCHTYIESHKAEAYEKGWSIHRHRRTA